MKIAVLEKQERINGHLKTFETSKFKSLETFLNECHNFDVVIIDKFFLNCKVVKHLQQHNLETVVLKDGEVDFGLFYVSDVIDYSEIDDIKEKMTYVETKLRMNKLIKKEEKNWSDIKSYSKHFSVTTLA